MTQGFTSRQRSKPIGQSAIAVGSSSGPVTGSTSYVDLTDMSVTLTTTGGVLLVWFSGTFTLDTTNLTTVGLSLDAATEVAEVSFSEATANFRQTLATVWRFSGVSAASHTIKVRWKVAAGSGTAVTTQRYLLVQEVPA